MKKTLLFTIFILYTLNSQSQCSEYLRDTNIGENSVFLNDDMYFTRSTEGDLHVARLDNISKSEINNTIINVVDLPDNYYYNDIDITGSTLYIVANKSKILEIDLNSDPIEVNEIYESSNIQEIAVDEYNLFVLEAITTITSYGDHREQKKIYSLDLTDTALSPVIMMEEDETALSQNIVMLYSMEVLNNKLFFSRSNTFKYIELNQKPYTVKDFSEENNGEFIYPQVVCYDKLNNHIYSADPGRAAFSLDILDASTSTPKKISRTLNILPQALQYMHINNGFLYTASGWSSYDYQYYKTDVCFDLSLSSPYLENDKNIIYFDATKNTIKVKGFNDFLKYNIYNALGKKVSSGEIKSTVNLNNLHTGIYFFNLENKASLKFYKN